MHTLLIKKMMIHEFECGRKKVIYNFTNFIPWLEHTSATGHGMDECWPGGVLGQQILKWSKSCWSALHPTNSSSSSAFKRKMCAPLKMLSAHAFHLKAFPSFEFSRLNFLLVETLENWMTDCLLNFFPWTFSHLSIFCILGNIFHKKLTA